MQFFKSKLILFGLLLFSHLGAESNQNGTLYFRPISAVANIITLIPIPDTDKSIFLLLNPTYEKQLDELSSWLLSPTFFYMAMGKDEFYDQETQTFESTMMVLASYGAEIAYRKSFTQKYGGFWGLTGGLHYKELEAEGMGEAKLIPSLLVSFGNKWLGDRFIGVWDFSIGYNFRTLVARSDLKTFPMTIDFNLMYGFAL